MRIAGLGLQLSGWIIVVASLPLLPSGGERGFFVAAGVLVELIGLVLLGRAHRDHAGGRE